MIPGTRLAGRFTIERRAGAGGMGTVYVARDLQTAQRVALKVLLAGERDALDLERFDREATVLSELAHPGIVRYVAHGVDENGGPYLAMEWVEGTTLADRLGEPLTREASLVLVRAVADALGAAHALGIVHRDIKPSNIVLDGGDVAQPRLLDFGIARHQGADRALTQTGAVIGTPGYMAPEQARGLTTFDARADVYALGCLLFRCITGRTPFVGEHPVAVLARTILEEAPHVCDLCPDVSMRIDELVASMLARDPSKRPTDGTAVSTAIRALAPDETEAAPPSLLAGAAITNTEQRFVTAVLGSPQRDGAPFDLRALADAAAAHDARFEALAGGSFVLVFATTSAPTDLAVRACRCALALRVIARDASLAIVSGRAVVRGSMPIGELLDRAAHAVAAAEIGAIAIDENTASLVSDRFVLEEKGGMTQLRRARSETIGLATGRTLLGRPTPCVGRDRELAFLEGLYDESVEESAARVALVVAPPGTGKSRLRRELLLRVAGRTQAPLVLLALGDPLRGAPMAMLGETLRRAAGCFEIEKRSDEASHLASWLGRRLDAATAASTVPLLVELAGFAPNPDAARGDDSGRGATLRAWTNWLDAELAAQPVLVVLEDLHWGDQSTVDFLDASLRAFAKRPLVVLALGRPEVKTLFPRLWAEREPQELRLGPLTRSASAALVRVVVPSETDEATISLLVDRAAGNAFFLEELIRTLADGSGSALPDTVLAMVQARLDALGPELTRALRAASVFGGSFWKEGIAAVLGVGGDSRRLEMWLTALVDRELVERRPETTIAGAEELVFRHDLVREGAYAMLVDEDRRLAHRLAAEWLESTGSREAAVLVEHYDRAGDAARAIQWSIVDATRALDSVDASAMDRAQRGIRLGASGVDLGRLLVLQARSLERLTDPRGFELAAQGLEYITRGTAPWYQGALVCAMNGVRSRDKELIATTFDSLVNTMPREEDPDAEVEYVVALGEALVAVGRADVPEVVPLLVGALTPYLARASEMAPRAASRLEGVQGMRYSMMKQPEAALRATERAVAYGRAAGELTFLAELTLVQRLAAMGELSGAVKTLDRIILEADRISSTIINSVARLARALAASVLGDHERAYELGCALRATPDLFRERSFVIRIDLLNAQSAFLTGRLPEGRAILDALPEVPKTSALWPRIQLGKANALLAEGRGADALALIEEARPLLGPSPFDQEDGVVALLHANALLATGNEERARKVIAEAVAQLREYAATVEDPNLRESFLATVPSHRALLALAAARGL